METLNIFENVVANYNDLETGQFIRKIYGHVAGALVVLVMIEFVLYSIFLLRYHCHVICTSLPNHF
jgi:hypothetical protein